MTKRRNSTADRGARPEADYAAAAEWAETNIPDLTGQTISSGDASREAARAMLDRALGADAGTDSPAEAYARALIRRGRPSLTAPGVHSKARQVRLPDTLDARLERYVALTHTTRSEAKSSRRCHASRKGGCNEKTYTVEDQSWEPQRSRREPGIVAQGIRRGLRHWIAEEACAPAG